MPTSKVFFTNSGSEANDTQIKLAWYYNNARGPAQAEEDHRRAARLPRHHHRRRQPDGPAVFHADFDLPMAGILHTDCPHYCKYAEPGETEEEYATRLARNLEDLIEREGPETIAAFIAEPVMGAGGVLIPPETYFEKVQAVLERHDIAFIADEVICGFGRTGNWWGAETFGIAARHDHHGQGRHLGLRADGRRDGAGARLPGAGGGERQARRVRATASPIRAIRWPAPWRSRPSRSTSAIKIVAHVQRVAPMFQLRLKALADHPLVGEARGVGLIGGTGTRQGQACQAELRCQARRRRQGCSPRRGGGRDLPRRRRRQIALCPPLVIDGAEINAMFDCVTRALDRTESWARKEGHL